MLINMIATLYPAKMVEAMKTVTEEVPAKITGTEFLCKVTNLWFLIP